MNKKGFTLIELLAVIIILGILILIAIPSVTKLISDSRKTAYVDTAKEIVEGVTTKINSEEFKFHDEETTYYVPSSCIRVENGDVPRSPYGEFDPAYVVVNYNGKGKGYDYYWLSRDDTGSGVKEPVLIDNLDEDDIESDIEIDDIDVKAVVDGRKRIVRYTDDCQNTREGRILPNGEYFELNTCKFEGELNVGSEFVDGQYTYRYKQEFDGTQWVDISSDGWGVVLTDKNSTAPVDTGLCATIDSKPIISMSYMFANSKTTSIDFSSFDTINVENMSNMFSNSTGITSVNLSKFATSRLSNMDEMFKGCTSLESIKLDEWNFSKISQNGKNVFTNTPSLNEVSIRGVTFGSEVPFSFFQSQSIKTIDATDVNLSGTRTLEGLFQDAKGLTEIIGLDTWDTSNIKDMSSMFSGCSALVTIDLSAFNTSNVSNYKNFFKNCSNLQSVVLDNWDITRISIGNLASGFFSGDSSLKSISTKDWKIPYEFTYWVSNWNIPSSVETIDVTDWDVSNTINLSYLFYNGTGIKSIIGTNTWDTSKLTNVNYMFSYCSNLESLNLDDWDVSKISSRSYFFYNDPKLKTLSLRNWAFGSSILSASNFYWYYVETIDVTDWDLSTVTSLAYAFYGASKLKTVIGLDTWDTSHVTNMSYMLYDCRELENFDLSKLNTSNVTNMNYTFYNNYLLPIDFSKFDTSNVTSMSYMLYGCRNMSHNFSNLQTNNVTNMSGMFGGLTVESLDLTSLDTSKVTDISYLFYNDTNLKSVNLNDLDTSKVTNINGLFSGC